MEALMLWEKKNYGVQRTRQRNVACMGEMRNAYTDLSTKQNGRTRKYIIERHIIRRTCTSRSYLSCQETEV
jgi:hypothetical protein